MVHLDAEKAKEPGLYQQLSAATDHHHGDTSIDK